MLTTVLIELLERHVPDIEIEVTEGKIDQLRGSDLKIKSNKIFDDDDYHVVDTKAAQDYYAVEGESGLLTFAMELGSIQRNQFQEGWAISKDVDGYYSATEYYLFQWIFVKDKSLGLIKENISSIEIKVVPKKEIYKLVNNPREFLIKNQLLTDIEIGYPIREISTRVENLYKYMAEKYEESIDGITEKTFKITNLQYEKKNKNLYLSPICLENVSYKGPKIVYTSPEKKVEAPLNMTVSKYLLDKISIYKDKLRIDENQVFSIYN
ncbi:MULTISPECIES: hypothetical protein [unclassified Streptococcus]|uniref:hypothetical protein n=1 Tax=unclassified Streptococcus TaxID=2608887 RepID=UPI001071C278|nr:MULTISPECIES: hypothetical protein [unclassified Streptococcus]MBF0805964.1 hypothetical protein [Streptococcus sp. 19428wA2_WM07]TFU28488.1 hypothetical protein E4T71_04015 [Streptococcus sp. WM07]